ncbi:two-component system sensor histidine kinase NtrB [Schlesneria paludicola]|uniref:two-component system sensor histidine kinase NtrB n=1 Tax=Schlesneria paludicola TaxID=360056 RepID=UPI0009FBC157|nr:ATP-binding protein [Schlesneria paludicola]
MADSEQRNTKGAASRPRKETVSALRESERRFRAISACTYDWESWHDEHGRLQWVNAAVFRMTGYSVEECLTMADYPLPIVCEEDRPRIAEILLLAALGTPGNDAEFRLRRRDGRECWGAISWQLITDEDGVDMGFRTSVRDIAERKRMEQQIADYTENLEQLVRERTARLLELEDRRAKLDRLAALGQLAAGVAHEINNPLAGIRNAVELIRESVSAEFENRPLLDVVQSEIDRIAGIVRQLYQLHRPQTVANRDVDLVKVAKQTIQLLSAISRRHRVHVVVTGVDGEIVLARLPEGELTQVLYNILLNAVQASPGGAQVDVSICVDEQYARMRVTDSGAGIPADIASKIFDPFFTTKHGTPEPGMGLGLSVSQSLIQAMGGQIDLESGIPGRTTFLVTVPRSLASPDPVAVQCDGRTNAPLSNPSGDDR